MENISLILSDLDGTLFRNDKTFSDFTKKTISEIQKKGILFGISTSRALVNVKNFLNGINPDILITNGGGIVFTGTSREPIYSCEFSVAETRAIIKKMFEVFGDDAIISVDNATALYSNSKEELGDKFWTFNDFSDFNEKAMKICVESLDKEKILQVASVIGLEEIDYHAFSDIPWYKLSKKGVTKEKAIEALCEKIKISPENVVAFGDDFNDIGMLQFCGKGIAMKNAIPEVKAIADEICLSNEEDGVAKWITENLKKA
ncbi:MAG: HAD family hydrolase [Treponemataceae bacterium]|nr:HAD family hydrolase [Treponemataceae bacterium]